MSISSSGSSGYLSQASSRSPSPLSSPGSTERINVVPYMGILENTELSVVVKRLSPRSALEAALEALKDQEADRLLMTADQQRFPHPALRSIGIAAVIESKVITPKLRLYLENNLRTLVDLEQMWVNGKPFDERVINLSDYLWLNQKLRPYDLKAVSFNLGDMKAFYPEEILHIALFFSEKGYAKEGFLFGEYIIQALALRGEKPGPTQLEMTVSEACLTNPDFQNLLANLGEISEEKPGTSNLYQKTIIMRVSPLNFTEIVIHVRKEGGKELVDDEFFLREHLRQIPDLSRRSVAAYEPANGWVFYANEAALIGQCY